MFPNPAAVATAVVLAAAPAFARTIQVPSLENPDIASAIDDAEPGDTILVAAGTYFGNLAFVEKSGIRLRARPGAEFENTEIYLFDCEGITIEGFTIRNAADWENAVVASDCTGIVLKNLVIEGYTSDAIRFVECESPRVTGCTVRDGNGGVRDVDSDELVVDRCVFEDLEGGGVLLSYGEGASSPRARVSRSTFDLVEAGILAEGTGVRIEGNTMVLASNGNGIVIGDNAGAQGAVIRKNRITATGEPSGILLYGNGGEISRNVVAVGSGLGIQVMGDACRIDRNRVTGGSSGCDVYGDDAGITGNVLESPGYSGMRILDGSGAEVSRNRILDAGVYGYICQQGDSFLTRNSVEGATVGFFSSVAPSTLTGNRAEGSGTADFATSLPEGAITLLKNRFESLQFEVE